VLAATLALLTTTPLFAADSAPGRALDVHGMIDAVTARYLAREVARADEDRTPLVIVRLDTAGGLESSMREMTQTLLASRVPVVVYVSPAGARAASAGMFVTLAANVAAMAPGTAIGAAHPVKLGGSASSDAILEGKIVNDVAALARAIAETRHRNGSSAERAVRDSVSFSAEEAQREGVVDIVARDLPDLLGQLDGRTVATAEGARTLHAAGLTIAERPMLATERVLQAISDPNIAYLLFLLGLIGIVGEVYHPGAILPGTLGGLSLLLALVAFGNLPIAWAGVLLIALAIGFFIAELHTGTSALAVCALVALVVGSLLLYSPSGPSSPAAESVRVSPWLIGGMTALIAAFFLLVVRATLRVRRLAVQTGIAALTGQLGVAASELAPAGTVRVDSEVWSAESEAGPIHEGEPVRVVGVSGVTLRVTRGALPWNHPRLPSTS
jgi:membrane-bound serine protease (ClpP class)